MILSTKEIFKCIQQSKGISKFCPVVLLITETIAKYVCSRLDLLTCIYKYIQSQFSEFQLYYIGHRFCVLPFADELSSHTTLNNFHHLISIGYINRNTENTEKVKVKKKELE